MKRKYINRELSWVEFNARVLSEAQNASVPLLERLKFLSIVSSNFDEFFMVRVAGLRRQAEQGRRDTDPAGMTAGEQLEAIHARVSELVTQKYTCLLDEVFPVLAREGIEWVPPDRWNTDQEAFGRRFFTESVFPVLTPLRGGESDRAPYLGNLRLHAAFLLDEDRLVYVPIPESLDRIVLLPSEAGRIAFTFLEQIVVKYAEELFHGFVVYDSCLLRITRDADMSVDEGQDEDFIAAMETVIEGRESSAVVRLQVSGGGEQIRALLMEQLAVEEREIYSTPNPLELKNLMEIYSIDGFSKLRDPLWESYPSPFIDEEEAVFESIRRRDILLHHPYESFDPVVRLVREAANDKNVLAIKMTLYRTSGDSPIIRALETAAENGKQVVVLVEVKARFDEERNIQWAGRLQRAGVIVVHGIAGLKVHAKAILIVRREETGIRRYAHLGTGNYNDKTARLYTDMGLLTVDDTLTYELGLVFNAITGYSVIPRLEKLSMAPHSLKPRLIELIRREQLRAEATGSGVIVAKMNSLADTDVIDALYDASGSGVDIYINVRGICMLVPNVTGMSKNIHVVSVIDRYLEHTRAFYFHNGGAEEIYLSSADWMPRNLVKRVELMFPVEHPEIRSRIKHGLELFFEDRQKAHTLNSRGTWKRRTGDGVRSQAEQQERIRDRYRAVPEINREEFKVRRSPGK